MRSRSARASDTSRSSSTTTAAGSCGPAPAATAGRSRSSSICSAKSAATRSSWCPATWPSWITGPVGERCPNASVCYDPFHLVKLATDALDEIRREVWNDARRQGQTQLAKELKGARFALWKNPGNLTERQQLKLARVQQLNQRLYRAYLLSQQLREIYRVRLDRRDRAARRLARVGPAMLASRRSSSSRARSPSSVPGSRRRFGTDSRTPGSSK